MAKLFARELQEVSVALTKAMRKRHRHMASTHEGYALILEELDELKAEVWRKQGNQRPKRLRKEAIQIAAIAAWFAMEVRNGHTE